MVKVKNFTIGHSGVVDSKEVSKQIVDEIEKEWRTKRPVVVDFEDVKYLSIDESQNIFGAAYTASGSTGLTFQQNYQIINVDASIAMSIVDGIAKEINEKKRK